MTRSLFKAYGVGLSILLLSASFYYVKNGQIGKLITLQHEMKQIEELRTAAINDPYCSKAGIEKGVCAAQVFEKSISDKQWSDTARILNYAAVVAFLSRTKKSAPLSCGLEKREIMLFESALRMEKGLTSEKPELSKNLAKKLKEKIGRSIASQYKERECTTIARTLKQY
jgi:hypothetical protein